jgi:hypothetical protein
MGLEAEGDVEVTLSVEELVLELDPVKSDGMEAALHDIHHHEDGHGHSPEGEPNNEGSNDSHGKRSIGLPGHRHHLFDEHGSQLRVSKGERPQSEVRGSVGDGTEDKLDGLDHLMDEEASERVVVDFVHTSLLVENLLVLFDISFVVFVQSHLVASVDDGLLIFSSGLSGLNVVEFLFFVSVVRRAAECKGTRLDTEHEGNTDGDHNSERVRQGSLRVEEVDSTGRISLDHFLVSLLHQVVNHGVDDARVEMELVN